VTAAVPPTPAELPGLNGDLGHEQLTTKLGIEITQWDADRIVGTMPVEGNRQPYGLLHGGASASLAETLGSTAAAMHAAPDRVALGLELSCTHHRAAKSGLVTGVCTPLHRGRSTATFQIAISDEDGKAVCTARLTCILRERPPGD
jgi:1,4-dihydroxy-2-naphthoyl-CoA hydrolase